MATFKKESRWIQAGTAAYLEFQLDPDIYKGDVATALGIVTTKPTGAGIEFIPYTVKLAKRSSSAAIIKMKMTNGTGDAQETRTIELLCDKDAAETAKAALAGKTVNIGPSGTSWTLKV